MDDTDIYMEMMTRNMETFEITCFIFLHIAGGGVAVDPHTMLPLLPLLVRKQKVFDFQESFKVVLRSLSKAFKVPYKINLNSGL